MKEHFSDEQLVEITALLTLVNLDRFNAAFGIGSAGFSDGHGLRAAGPPGHNDLSRPRGVIAPPYQPPIGPPTSPSGSGSAGTPSRPRRKSKSQPVSACMTWSR